MAFWCSIENKTNKLLFYSCAIKYFSKVGWKKELFMNNFWKSKYKRTNLNNSFLILVELVKTPQMVAAISDVPFLWNYSKYISMKLS